MSLPASQRRALDQIEKTLADDHPGLGPLFAIFTGLTGPRACAPGTVTTVAAHARSVQAGRQPGCATQQNEPGKTRQSGLYAH
jgi:hypothetical protein